MFGRFDDDEDAIRTYIVQAIVQAASGIREVVGEEIEAYPSEMREEVFRFAKDVEFPKTLHVWELVEVAQWDDEQGGYFLIEDEVGHG